MRSRWAALACSRPHLARHCRCHPTADYKALKDLIKAAAEEEANAGPQAFSPRTTSLTVQRAADRRDSGACAEQAIERMLHAWCSLRSVA